jgi:hypothetical protein
VARSVDLHIVSAQFTGPMDEAHWIAPENYGRFFPRDKPPATTAERDVYAGEVLRAFAARAFRRPVEDAKVAQLVAIAHRVYAQPGARFEDGVARAIMGVLASPHFLFRLEAPAAGEAAKRFADVDDYALASRLSYFLWSSMPDEELTGLAARGALRGELPAQVARMLKDNKAQAFARNFPGQWLQARDIETVPINARAVLGVGNARGNTSSRADLDNVMRRAMRSETEMVFDYVLREDRSVLEFIDADYTFLNAKLATHYGLPAVEGDTLRRVTLPEGSPRGGFLTEGTVLSVTSNPTRTSRDAATAPAPGHSRARGIRQGRRRPGTPAARGARRPPQPAALRLLPRAHGSARVCAGEFQRDGHVARRRCPPADRSGGRAGDRRKILQHPRFETPPDARAPAGLLPLPDGENAHLRPRPRPRLLRRANRRPDRG